VVTLGLLHALKGVGNRAFYRWLTRDYRPLFPQLPERTRLFRLFKTHQDWTQVFLAAPTVLGGIDTYGIELIHPMREGRSPQQIGRKGLSNHRWIVGGTLCLLLNQYGLVVAWTCATANVADNTFQSLRVRFPDACFVLSSPNAQVFGGLDHGVGHCRPLSINLLYALLAIPLVYCHINNFQRASRLVRPFQGGEKMTAIWASHHEELCSDGVVAPPACVHMVVPHR